MKSGRLANMKDVRWEPLYDTFALAAVPLTNMTTRFFSTGISPVKTKNETNMVNNGSLPSPNAFRCHGLRMEAFIAGTVADNALLVKLAMDSYVRFFVGTKDYFTAPLATIVGKMKFHVAGLDIVTGNPVSYVQLGKPSHYGYRFPKEQYIDIVATENFGVEWVIATSAITPSAPVEFKMYLDGLRGVDVR